MGQALYRRIARSVKCEACEAPIPKDMRKMQKPMELDEILDQAGSVRIAKGRDFGYHLFVTCPAVRLAPSP